jgi:glutathione S-transferase
MLKVTAFKWVPPFAQGYVRDLRVRWTCEEAGIPYQLRLIGREQQTSESYRLEQPFSQVPVLEDGELTLFESGAIVLHIGEKSKAVLPKDPSARARAKAWVFGALNSIEPFVQNLVEVEVFYPKEEWAIARKPVVVAALKQRLSALSKWLENRE